MSKLLFIIRFCVMAFIVLIVSCSKETSTETGIGFGSSATGTLQDATGNCQPIIVTGNYAVDTVLNDSNYITVNSTITKTGAYKIYTDTVNGMWFRDTGFTLSSGAKAFKLKGYGKPILPVASTFTVIFSNTFCSFTINVPSSNGGGNNPPVTGGDYFPTTANSNWTYTDSITSTDSKTIVNTVPKVFNGNTYSVFVTDGTDSNYYRKANGNYYEYVYESYLGPVSPAVEVIFLKDNVPVNTTWDTPPFAITGVSNSFFVRYKIVQKDVTVSLKGKTYTNVIVVTQDFYNSGIPLNNLTSTIYFAKGIGNVGIYNPAGTFNLKNYQVF